MKKRVTQHDVTEYVLGFAVMTCPFCGARTVENPAMPWCPSCRVEYRRRGPVVTFDDQLKTDRFAWGKALNAAGGVRIGGKS